MIVVVGLSHKTAPIEIRERLALPQEAALEVLELLLLDPSVAEAMVVSTCNRVELILAPKANGPTLLDLELAAERVLKQRAPAIVPHLYRHSGKAAVRHLFSVASSLDSLVLGEPQILGQVKQAFESGRARGAVGSTLTRVVIHAVRTAKRVRNETLLGAGQVSVPSVALELAQQIFGDLKGKQAVLIGSGEMAETVAKLLTQAGAKLVVLGRNSERVRALAERMGGVPKNLSELEQTLATADVLVTATSAPGFVVTHEVVARAQKKRRGKNLFLIDLAVPRDIEPRISELESVFLYNVDDFMEVVAQGTSQRGKEANLAQEIVESEVLRLERVTSAEQVTPIVVSMRRNFSQILQGEFERSLRGKLKHLGLEEREAVRKMFDASLNKMFHHPTRRLRQLASDSPPPPELEAYVETLVDLFALEEAAAQPGLGSEFPPEPLRSEPSWSPPLPSEPPLPSDPYLPAAPAVPAPSRLPAQSRLPRDPRAPAEPTRAPASSEVKQDEASARHGESSGLRVPDPRRGIE